MIEISIEIVVGFDDGTLRPDIGMETLKGRQTADWFDWKWKGDEPVERIESLQLTLEKLTLKDWRN